MFTPPSNTTAWLAQLLIFFWCTTLVLQSDAVLTQCPPWLIGGLLTCATLALPVMSFRSSIQELRVVRDTEMQARRFTRTMLDTSNRRKDFSEGDYIVREAEGTQFVLEAPAFADQYELVKTRSPEGSMTTADGFVRYRSTAKIWAHELSKSDVATHFPSRRFVGGNGNDVVVTPGSVLIIPFPDGGELYCIEKEIFDKTYVSAVDVGVPSQAETFAEWGRKIETSGKLHRKIATVHAKVAATSGIIETTINGVCEARAPYERSDYIVVGNRGGRYPVRATDFAARYLITHPEPATHPDLDAEHFQLYHPKGLVWCYKLSADEQKSSFPAGTFLGIWGTPVTVRPGDVLAMPFGGSNEIYVIPNATFRKSYILALNSRVGYIPSEPMALAHWESTLRRDAQIFQKSTMVYAKIAPSDGTLSDTEGQWRQQNDDTAEEGPDETGDAPPIAGTFRVVVQFDPLLQTRSQIENGDG